MRKSLLFLTLALMQLCVFGGVCFSGTDADVNPPKGAVSPKADSKVLVIPWEVVH